MKDDRADRTAASRGREEVLEKENRRLAEEIEELRRSYSFRLGKILIEAALSPVRRLPRLPIDLYRLVNDYLRGRKLPAGQPKAPGLPAKPSDRTVIRGDKRRYLKPGIDEHNCTAFAPLDVAQGKPRRKVRIALVVSQQLATGFRWEANCLELSVKNWRVQLTEFDPDILILEPPYGKISGGLDYAFFADGCEILRALMEWCKGNGVRICIWDTRPPKTSDFAEIPLKPVDLVCTIGYRGSRRYAALDPKKLLALDIAIQPALHNPARPAATIGPKPRRGILFDGWADAIEWPDYFGFLEKLVRYDLVVTESRYRFVANKLDDLPGIRESVHGNIGTFELLTAYRESAVVLMTSCSLSAPAQQAKRAMEAIACGAYVVWVGKAPDFLPIEAVWHADTPDDAVEMCKRLVSRGHELALENRRKRRAIESRYVLGYQVDKMLTRLGFGEKKFQCPLVTLVTASKRPEKLESAYGYFDGQRYPNLEWVIVVNSLGREDQKLPKCVTDDARVTILFLPREKNIGACLNLGIERAKGKYWFKFDDDDIYGPHYVGDMLYEAIAVDADVFGKPTGYVYLEESDSLVIRNSAFRSEYRVGRNEIAHICGATISGKADNAQIPAFSEELRASVDTNFIRRCGESGIRLYTSSISGFVAVREADKAGHTWRAGDSQIMQNSRKVGTAKDIESALR